MAAKHSILGLKQVLKTWVDTMVGGTYLIGLFADDLIPDYDLVDADYLAGDGLPDFAGYAVQPLEGWAPSFQDVEHARATAATYTFTNTDVDNPNSIYGYVITDAANTSVILAERDPVADTAPVVMGNVPGETYKVTPNLSTVNEA